MAAVAASARHDRPAFTPAVDAAPLPLRAHTWATLWPPLRGLLVVSWIGVFVSVFFQPAPNPHVAEPWLTEVLSVPYTFALLGGAVMAVNGVWRAGLGCSLAASSMGLVMAYECAVTLHHAPVWWIYELAAFGYLTALSVGGVLVRARADRV